MERLRLLVIGCLMLVLALPACGSDTVDANNGSLDDMGGSDVSTPDASETDMGQTDDSGMDQPDFPLFDFGSPDTGDMGPAILEIQMVTPPRGPVEGGTPVVIQGTGFSQETRVFFGGFEADVDLIDGNLLGQAPAASGPGPVTVKVFDPTLGDDFLDGGYEYVATLQVDAVSPDRIPTAGGVEVLVDGRGFDENTRVSLGGETALRHTLLSGNQLRVLAPPRAAGVVSVRATNRDATFELPAAVTYYDRLEILAVRPATGPPEGGNAVTITGSGFEPDMTLEFGGVAASIVSVDATGNEAIVTVPAHAVGLVDVRAQTTSDATIAEDAYYYAPAGTLAIGAITPNEGQSVGGSQVVILGAGLDDASLSVEFDGIAGTVVDAGEGWAIVQVPAHSTGTVDVTVRTTADSDTLPQGFTYVEDLWIDKITPNEGDVAGTYTVRLEGEGFTGASRVRFGGVDATTFTVIDDTNIDAEVPAHSAGVVDVEVVRGSVQAKFLDGFTYTEPIEVFSIIPTRGSVAGNTYVTILGRGFVGNLAVEFDQIPGTDVQVRDAQTLTVRAPAHDVGDVDVVVKRGADAEATSPTPYTYFNPGARFGGAWGGPIQGAVNVTVYEMGGAPIEGAFVMLSTNIATPYQGYTDPNGMVTLSGPDVFGSQTVTAIAAGYSSASVQNVNAENITIFLQPPPQQGPPGPGPPLAVFEGRVSGLDKLAEPGPTQFQMAIVYTTQSDPWTDNPDAGGGNVVLSDGPYTLNSRIGDVALIAVGGLYDNATREFIPLRMGIERFLFAGEGQTQNVDLDLTIPLETAMSFKLNQPPRGALGPDTNEVVPWLDLGFEGVFGQIDAARGQNDIVTANHMAPLTGVIADASYYAIGGAVSSSPFGGPSSIAFKRGITDTSSIVEMPPLMGIAELTYPTNGQVPQDRLFQFTTNSTNTPDFYWVIVMDFMQSTKWEVFLPGSATSFRLPDFPDFSHLPAEERPVPYPGGSYIMNIVAISAPGFSYSNLSYSDLSLESWDAYSAGGEVITF